jgi:hypothetical protein
METILYQDSSPEAKDMTSAWQGLSGNLLSQKGQTIKKRVAIQS